MRSFPGRASSNYSSSYPRRARILEAISGPVRWFRAASHRKRRLRLFAVNSRPVSEGNLCPGPIIVYLMHIEADPRCHSPGQEIHSESRCSSSPIPRSSMPSYRSATTSRRRCRHPHANSERRDGREREPPIRARNSPKGAFTFSIAIPDFAGARRSRWSSTTSPPSSSRSTGRRKTRPRPATTPSSPAISTRSTRSRSA